MHQSLRQLRNLPYGDKAGHFLLYGGLTFLLNLALDNHRTKLFSRPVLSGSLLVGAFAVLEEFTQIALPTRNFELVDILFDLFGIITFSYLALRLNDYLSGQEPATE